MTFAHRQAGLDKHTLRQRCLAALRAIDAERRERYSAALRENLRGLLRECLPSVLSKRGGAVLALYAPLPHEVNLMPLLHECPGYRYLFPRCLPGRRLQFHYVSSPEHELELGAHGILAPLLSCPVAEPQEIDLVVVPGVAFTLDGKRLGYGGGYYDRFLPLCPHATILSLAFPWQILADIPTEPHDLRIGHILLPRRTQPEPAPSTQQNES